MIQSSREQLKTMQAHKHTFINIYYMYQLESPWNIELKFNTQNYKMHDILNTDRIGTHVIALFESFNSLKECSHPN